MTVRPTPQRQRCSRERASKALRVPRVSACVSRLCACLWAILPGGIYSIYIHTRARATYHSPSTIPLNSPHPRAGRGAGAREGPTGGEREGPARCARVPRVLPFGFARFGSLEPRPLCKVSPSSCLTPRGPGVCDRGDGSESGERAPLSVATVAHRARGSRPAHALTTLTLHIYIHTPLLISLLSSFSYRTHGATSRAASAQRPT